MSATRVVSWKKGAHAGFTKWHMESERPGWTLCRIPINPRAPSQRKPLAVVRNVCANCMAEHRVATLHLERSA